MNLAETFQAIFGEGSAIQYFFAPGRVNLIGEHIDYNGGHVFPCALDVGTYAAARKRTDRTLRLYSMNFQSLGVVEVNMDRLTFDSNHDWANYPKGVAATLIESGYSLENGADVVFYGNIPNGAGLSSSASIELTTCVLLRDFNELELSMTELVKIAQRAENEFVGVNCGIMDQFAIGMGKQDHALLLDCQTLEYQYSPIHLEDEVLVIANTNKQRGLADSAYNTRREECERALVELQQHIDIASLGDLSSEEFERLSPHIKQEADRKRARHAVYENLRTIEAVNKLKAGDIKGFGNLMNASHLSLRNDYEVTGKELDALVEASWEEGALGARMTGAGFGGCTISIVKKNDIERYKKAVGRKYFNQTGLHADFYVVNVSDGAKKLTEGVTI